MNPADLDCLEVIPDALARAALKRRNEDQRELLRIAAVSALANGGKHLDPKSLALAKKRAAVPALLRPLGTGEPLSSPQHLEA